MLILRFGTKIDGQSGRHDGLPPPKRDERKEERKRVESNVEEPAKCLPQRGPVSYVFHASCQAKLATPLSSRTGAILLQETSYKQQLYQDG